jgi:TrpR-related protein YerC/YecD
MAEKHASKNAKNDVLFQAILSLRTLEECYEFFEDLCTMKELADMAQRVDAARMLLAGCTYEQIVKDVEISTATISRINRCIQYGDGGYEKILKRIESADTADTTKQ